MKSLQKDEQTTDDRWSEKLTWAFSSGELTTPIYIPLLQDINALELHISLQLKNANGLDIYVNS